MRDRENIDSLLFSVSEEDGSHAFHIFYDLYYRSVFRFCYYILHDRDATAEVVSDVFVAVWRSRKRLREVSDIEAYLRTAARNESLRYMRRKRRLSATFTLEKFPPPARVGGGRRRIAITRDNPRRQTAGGTHRERGG